MPRGILGVMIAMLLLVCGSGHLAHAADKAKDAQAVRSGEDFKEKSGDLGAFLIEHTKKLGVAERTDINHPEVSGDWSYKEDKKGYELHVDGDRCAELIAFFTFAFGRDNEPSKDASDNKNSADPKAGLPPIYGPGYKLSFAYGKKNDGDGTRFTKVAVAKWEKKKDK